MLIIKRSVTAIILSVAFFTAVDAQRPTAGTPVIPLKLAAGSNSVDAAGDLSSGKKIELGWAEKSNVACFPGTRFEMFNGNHVFYRIDMPARSRMTIELVPKDGAAVNLYALRLGAGSTLVPPAITSAISCEAKYPIYANKPGGGTIRNADDGTRKIEFISVGAAYTILIGVAGAQGLSAGSFSLSVKVDAR